MNLPPLFSREFPTYERECYDNRVDVLWYQPAFSQSQYPPGQEGSEACTLICLLVAQGISQNEINLWDVDDCWDLSVVIAQAIAEGNRTHAWIMRQGLVAYAYLNTEEALKYGGNSLKLLREWTFHVYHEDIRERLFQNIQFHLRNWYEQPKSENLFMLLIASGRTILFTFQEKTFKVTLFDSHTHNAGGLPPRGLVVAQTSFDHLRSLCEWYVRHVLTNCYKIRPAQYELAFVYHVKSNGRRYQTSQCSCQRC